MSKKKQEKREIRRQSEPNKMPQREHDKHEIIWHHEDKERQEKKK